MKTSIRDLQHFGIGCLCYAYLQDAVFIPIYVWVYVKKLQLTEVDACIPCWVFFKYLLPRKVALGRFCLEPL